MKITPALLHLLQQVTGLAQFANAALIFPKNHDASALVGATIQAFSAWVQQIGNAAVPPPPAQKA